MSHEATRSRREVGANWMAEIASVGGLASSNCAVGRQLTHLLFEHMSRLTRSHVDAVKFDWRFVCVVVSRKGKLLRENFARTTL